MAVLAGTAFLVLGAVLTVTAEEFRGRDFFCYWVGPHLLASGQDPYRYDVWRDATSGLFLDAAGRLRPTACWEYYPAPLWTAVVMLPLGVLPLGVAATLWMAFSVGGTVAGLALIWRAAAGRGNALLFYLLVIFSQPFWVLLVGGQFAGVLLLATGLLVWGLARRRDRTAGLGLASLAIKPQLFVLFAPAVIVRALRDGRRALVLAAIAAGAIVLAASLVIAPSWPLEWYAASVERLKIARVLATAWGLAADMFGDVRIGLALVVAAVTATYLPVRGLRLSAVELAALALPLSLFASPHTWSYDFLLLALTWGVTLALASRGHPHATVVRFAVVLCASLLPWVLYAVALAREFEPTSGVLPVLSGLVLAFALRSRA